MNKCLLFLVLITFSNQSNAQIQEGMILTGGSFGFSGENSYSNDHNSGSNDLEKDAISYDININPEIGRFISESTLFGVGLYLGFMVPILSSGTRHKILINGEETLYLFLHT
ncbi:MAG: hypothetical protein ACI81Y_001905 [Glaciecola sp.]|jgi:hypothetical protein